MIAQIDKLYTKLGIKKIYVRLLSYFWFEGRPAGTKGQWFNIFTLNFLKVLTNIPIKNKVEKPILIGGMGRSGTTFIGLMLSAHPEVCYLNEPKGLWYIVSESDDIIGSYSISKPKYVKSQDDASEHETLKAQKLYSWFLKLSNHNRVADKYPEMLMRLPYFLKIFPKAKVLLILRDGTETIHSVANFNPSITINSSSGVKENWWGVNDQKWITLVDQVVSKEPDLSQNLKLLSQLEDDQSRAAIEWIITSRWIQKSLREFPQNTYLVKYEKLINNPDSELKNICDFLELSHSPEMQEFTNLSIKSHMNSGKKKSNKMPDLHKLVEKAFNEELKKWT